jgi:hypothetical protein
MRSKEAFAYSNYERRKDGRGYRGMRLLSRYSSLD